MGAGSSAASWSMAALRAGRGTTPTVRRRIRIEFAVICRPGAPPGNSHCPVVWLPRAAWPRRSRSARASWSSWSGRRSSSRPKRDRDPVVVLGEVVGGQPDDAGELLPIEQGEQAGDAQLDGDGGVVQQPLDQRPALVIVDRGSWTGSGGERTCRSPVSRRALAQRRKLRMARRVIVPSVSQRSRSAWRSSARASTSTRVIQRLSSLAVAMAAPMAPCMGRGRLPQTATTVIVGAV